MLSSLKAPKETYDQLNTKQKVIRIILKVLMPFFIGLLYFLFKMNNMKQFYTSVWIQPIYAICIIFLISATVHSFSISFCT